MKGILIIIPKKIQKRIIGKEPMEDEGSSASAADELLDDNSENWILAKF